MKIGVAGTGAVGGYYGGFLRKADNEVIFLSRGKSYETLKENGLRIESDSANFTINGVFTDQYTSFFDVDLVLFCVKSTDTLDVANALFPILKENAVILTLQNGVDNEEILAEIFGRQRLFSAAAYIQASIKELGVVKQTGTTPQLVIGAIDSRMDEKAKAISTLLNDANLKTTTSDNILRVKWQKLLWNVTFNPLSAITESMVGPILDHEGLCSTAEKICKEAISVARASGIELDYEFSQKIMAQGQLARHHQTSMLQDRLKGKRMEIDSICGFIVRKGKELQVETPVLETIYHQLHFAENVQPKPSFSEIKLISEVKKD